MKKKKCNPFYQTKEWKKMRKQVLSRDNYLCVLCLKKNIFRNANTVHHIKHLDKYPELALDVNNLISLCECCHNEVHPEKRSKKKNVKDYSARVIKI